MPTTATSPGLRLLCRAADNYIQLLPSGFLL